MTKVTKRRKDRRPVRRMGAQARQAQRVGRAFRQEWMTEEVDQSTPEEKPKPRHRKGD